MGVAATMWSMPGWAAMSLSANPAMVTTQLAISTITVIPIISGTGDNTVITFPEGGSITLVNVKAGTLDATDFSFHQKLAVDGI